jgi:hypothetical protein
MLLAAMHGALLSEAIANASTSSTANLGWSRHQRISASKSSQLQTGSSWPVRWTPRTASIFLPTLPTSSSTSCANMRRAT